MDSKKLKMLSKLERVLTEYCDMSIFTNEEFLSLAKFSWGCSFGYLKNEEGIFTTHEEVLSNTRGIFFPSIGFTHNPFWDSTSKLTPEQREERYRARIYIRKIFLRQDGCNLDDVLNILFDYDENIKNQILYWTEGQWTGGLVIDMSTFSDDFCIDRLYKKKNIDKKYFDTGALNSMDIFILYLYGQEIHEDDSKKALLDAYLKAWGDRIYCYIDMQMVIIYEMVRHIILPSIKGYKKWLNKNSPSSVQFPFKTQSNQ